MVRRRPTIVIVSIDTLRPDHLGCYGYSKPTSPAIDALAGESVVFDQAIAAAIPTMPSFTTLMTGLHPYRHGIVGHCGQRRLGEGIVGLPEMARQGGYLTVACDNLVIQGGGTGTHFARGYDHYSGFLYQPFSDQSTQITDRALAVLREHRTGEKPLFLFLHYWDPHTPYGPLPPFDTLHYVPGSGPVRMEEVRQLAPDYYDAFLADMKLRHPDDYAYVVAQYDGEISQVDVQVGRLVAALRARDDWDNTAVVVLSDHGECFGEGNFYFDHHGLYDAVTRITLLARLPGQPAGRVGALVSTEDVMPTLAELGGLELPAYSLDGASLLPLLDGRAQAVRGQVISAEASRQASLALRTEDWKLIVPIMEDAEGRPLPDFYGQPRCPDPLLFDLRADPRERRDVALEHPARCAEMGRTLREWRAEMGRVTGEADPIMAQGLSLHYDRFMGRLLARHARSEGAS